MLGDLTAANISKILPLIKLKNHILQVWGQILIWWEWVCMYVHQFLQAFASADYPLQIYLAFCLWLLIDAQRCLLCISFTLPLYICKKQLKTSVTEYGISPAVPSIKQRGLKVRPPHSALPPSLWYEFAVGIIHTLSSSLLDRHRKLCFHVCHFTSRLPHKHQPGEIM